MVEILVDGLIMVERLNTLYCQHFQRFNYQSEERFYKKLQIVRFLPNFRKS